MEYSTMLHLQEKCVCYYANGIVILEQVFIISLIYLAESPEPRAVARNNNGSTLGVALL